MFRITKPHQIGFSKELCSNFFVILIYLEYSVFLIFLHILSLLIPRSINSFKMYSGLAPRFQSTLWFLC